MGTATYICANTGQVVRLALQTITAGGDRIDGYVPIVTSIIFPDLTVAAGYPMAMTRLDTGLYVHGLQLPSGADGLGTYIASVFWMEATSSSDWIGLATLIDGYASVTLPGGLPSTAIITFSRKTAIGQIGDLSILNQTTSGFTLASSSIHDQSEINWTWFNSNSSNIGSGVVTLVDGYGSVTPIGGVPSAAIVSYNRKTELGQIGELSIGVQNSLGFTLVSSSQYDQSELNWTWFAGNNSDMGTGSAVLVDGYIVVTPIGGVPSGAVVNCSRKTSIGSIGDLSITNQTTTGFTIMSSSQYDQSEINWVWFGETASVSGVVYLPKWEIYAINAARPFGISSVSPV